MYYLEFISGEYDDCVVIFLGIYSSIAKVKEAKESFKTSKDYEFRSKSYNPHFNYFQVEMDKRTW